MHGAIYACGCITENVEHYLLYCSNFDIQRNIMFNDINYLSIVFQLQYDLLLFGENALHIDAIIVCSSVQKYIKDNKRFSFWQPLNFCNHILIIIFYSSFDINIWYVRTLTINFNIFDQLLKKGLPNRSLLYFMKCTNLHGVSTNSVRAQQSKRCLIDHEGDSQLLLMSFNI